ncbi:MAG: thymidylate synthase [Candidatus Moraniibacteriota bacterium]|nr:MAG: thymidylate synthase [Candidatus Moranbacteria bacterium]
MKKHPEYQYLDLLKDILKNGVWQEDKGTGDRTKSVFGRQIRFDLSEGFPLLTTKKTYWKGIVYELAWFLSGQANIRFLVENGVHIWDDYPYRLYRERMEKEHLPEITKEEFVEKIKTDLSFSKKFGELRNIYGEMWRRWPAKDGRTIDQLRWAVEEITRDSDCHNAIVTSWNPEYLYTMAKPEEALRFPICHNMYQLNVKNRRVSLHLYQRSADIFLGVPFNIASYALLTFLIAKATGYKPGEFVHTFGDAHIYEDHMDQVKEQLQRKPLPFPKVRISSTFRGIDDFHPEQVKLVGYQSHSPLKARMALVGGVSSKSWKAYAKKSKKENKR